MINSLLIVGAGGHGRVVADAAKCVGIWQHLAFVDDRYPDMVSTGKWPVIGKIDDLESLIVDWGQVVIAIGENTIRQSIQSRCRTSGFEIANVIHPSAQIAEDVTIGNGSVVFANAVINTGSTIGESCIINTAATVDHDNKIEDAVHISPGAHLAGGVFVGTRSWVGIGASIIQNVKLGSDVVVGAGSVVTENIGDSLTVMGVPARQITK